MIVYVCFDPMSNGDLIMCQTFRARDDAVRFCKINPGMIYKTFKEVCD